MKRLIIMALVALGATTLKAQTRMGETYNLPPVKYLNTELDGSITVRSYGEGKRKADAREQARKNAVYTIMFKGIEAKGQPIRPLVTEANAYERHEDYFATFFADGGTYKEFVSTQDEKYSSKQKMRGSTQNAFGSVVRVLRGQLKARRIADCIIEKQ